MRIYRPMRQAGLSARALSGGNPLPALKIVRIRCNARLDNDRRGAVM